MSEPTSDAEPATESADAAVVDEPVGVADSTTLAVAAARAADAKKAHDVRILQVGETFGAADYFILASASNDRQVRAIVDSVEERLMSHGAKPRSREGMRDGGWILLDYGDIVVHAFLDDVREFYQLERLWADSPTLVWEPDPAPNADDPGTPRDVEPGAVDDNVADTTVQA